MKSDQSKEDKTLKKSLLEVLLRNVRALLELTQPTNPDVTFEAHDDRAVHGGHHGNLKMSLLLTAFQKCNSICCLLKKEKLNLF